MRSIIKDYCTNQNLPKLTPQRVRISNTHTIELSSKYNLYDGSHYHAISLQKFKRDAYDEINKTMTGKILFDVPLGIQAAENAGNAILDFVSTYKNLKIRNFIADE